MQSTGQSSDKKSYRVILLLVVGLAAFSSAMKELNQIQDLTLQTSSLIAQVSNAIAPADKVETLVQVETCEKIVPPPVPAVPSIPRVTIQRVPSIRVPHIRVPEAPRVELDSLEIVVPDALPPAPRRVRVVKPRRSVDKETINLRSASNLIQKRDTRSNG